MLDSALSREHEPSLAFEGDGVSMKVLVTGATGYIGSAVCAALQKAGHQPVGLARSQEAEAKLQSAGVPAIAGALEDLESLRNAVDAVDSVIHTASSSTAERGALDHAATQAILERLAGSNRAFVYTSGVWIYGDTRGRVVGEINTLNPPPSIAWRVAVEQMVETAAERKIQTVVLRPGMVFGRNGGFVRSFFDDVRATGAVHFPGTGENHWSNVHVDDLAELYVKAAAEPAAGEIFIACGGMPQPMRKIALAVAKAAGAEGKIEGRPLAQAQEQWGAAIAGCLAMDSKAASTKAARFFGWTVRHASIYDEIFYGSYVK